MLLLLSKGLKDVKLLHKMLVCVLDWMMCGVCPMFISHPYYGLEAYAAAL